MALRTRGANVIPRRGFIRSAGIPRHPSAAYQISIYSHSSPGGDPRDGCAPVLSRVRALPPGRRPCLHIAQPHSSAKACGPRIFLSGHFAIDSCFSRPSSRRPRPACISVTYNVDYHTGPGCVTIPGVAYAPPRDLRTQPLAHHRDRRERQETPRRLCMTRTSSIAAW